MKQKKIIIIGATSGIGAAVADIYVQKGHLVGITGRRAALLEKIKAELGPQVFISPFDVTSDEAVEKLKELIAAMGGLDLLIYNAGYGDVSKQLDWKIEEETVRTNVLAFTAVVSFAFSYFTGQGFGQIAITSSVAAVRGNSWAPAYSASKAFMSNYAESLAMKAWKMKKQIRVTEVRPGFVDTKMARGNKRFWVATTAKAARQIVNDIEGGKRISYVTRRWRLIAWLMGWMPWVLYRRIG